MGHAHHVVEAVEICTRDDTAYTNPRRVDPTLTLHVGQHAQVARGFVEGTPGSDRVVDLSVGSVQADGNLRPANPQEMLEMLALEEGAVGMQHARHAVPHDALAQFHDDLAAHHGIAATDDGPFLHAQFRGLVHEPPEPFVRHLLHICRITVLNLDPALPTDLATLIASICRKEDHFPRPRCFTGFPAQQACEPRVTLPATAPSRFRIIFRHPGLFQWRLVQTLFLVCSSRYRATPCRQPWLCDTRSRIRVLG